MIAQLGIALFGLTALLMLHIEHAKVRSWGSVVGLCGQPFWLYATGSAGQWGMFALCCAYTGVYVWGVRRFYRQWKESR